VAGGVTGGTAVRTIAFVGAVFEETNDGALGPDFFTGPAKPRTGKEKAICTPTKATLKRRTDV
jgi:hypothetical protein